MDEGLAGLMDRPGSDPTRPYTRLENATTPRWQPSTAARAVEATPASSATRATCLSRSMSCLVTRTKSPGVMSSAARTSSRGSPRAQR